MESHTLIVAVIVIIAIVVLLALLWRDRSDDCYDDCGAINSSKRPSPVVGKTDPAAPVTQEGSVAIGPTFLHHSHQDSAH